MTGHALLSPSGAAKWLNCPNSILAESGQPDVGSKDARNSGSDKHELMEKCLNSATNASDYIGDVMQYGSVVDSAFAEDVQVVVSGVNEVVASYYLTNETVMLYVEQKVPIGFITGELEATGTADVIILAGDEICIIDAKFGFVVVDAFDNPQMKMYAAGAAKKFLPYKFTSIRMMIAQPSAGHKFSEASLSYQDLMKWVYTVHPRAKLVRAIYKSGQIRPDFYNPGVKQCKWCAAQAVCPARKEKTLAVLNVASVKESKMLLVDQLTLKQMADMWADLDFVESYVKSIRMRVDHELMNGNAVEGLKLVEGRRGNRVWASDAKAEAYLSDCNLDASEVFEKKLRGPRQILDLLTKEQCKEAEKLIVQRAGKFVVAVQSDKRVAVEITPVIDDFNVVL